MQIDSVLQAIDEELNRLQKAREIIAALMEPAMVAPQVRRPAKASPRASRKKASPPPPTMTVLPPRQAPQRRPRKLPPPPVPPAVLRGAVPKTPVVVAPPAVKQPGPSLTPRPEPAIPGSFAALVQAAERELLS